MIQTAFPERIASLDGSPSVASTLKTGVGEVARSDNGAGYVAHEQPLPVLKVLYRNTARIHATGGDERLHTVKPAELTDPRNGGQRLLKAMYAGDMKAAEQTFAAISQADRTVAYNDLQHLVQDAPDVHRVTLSWRVWEVLQLVGYEHANTLLRQSVRYCVEVEQNRVKRNQPEPPLRKLTPHLLDEYALLSKQAKPRKADAAWIEKLAQTIFSSSREQAAEAVAHSLAEGFSTEDIGEAMSLAGNLLVLHDPGRKEDHASGEKPKDSVHGASVGVHASDAANAWRSIARVTNRRNQICSLIVGAWHRRSGQVGRVAETPFLYDGEAIHAENLDADALMAKLDTAVQSKNQSQAMAVVKS